MSEVRVTPGVVYQLSGETLPWTMDFAAAIPSGGALATPTSSLTDIDTGASYAAGLVGSPTISTTTVVQVVTALVVGHTYRLTVYATISGTRIPGAVVLIECVAD